VLFPLSLYLSTWPLANIRLQDDKKLEYHVPASFDATRPGFTYLNVEYAVKIDEHPVASKIPRASSRPAIVGNVGDLESLMRGPDTPENLEDFLYSDLPQLYVKIISFEDATVVSLTWPHTFLDAMGRVALFKNWIAVLEGREDDVQPLNGYDTDPLATLGSKPAEESLIAKWQISGLSVFIFVIRYLFDLLWHSKEETRVVCVPGRFIQDLRQETLEELARDDTKGDDKPFVSEGDVICSWWTRTLIGVLQPSPSRTIAIMNALGMRNALSKDLLPIDSAYVSNASISVMAFVSVTDIIAKPLSYVALKLREAIALQGTRAQIEAFTYNMRESLTKTGRAPLYGNSSMLLVIFSNWSAGKFFEIDFSAAVLRPGLPLEKRSNALGRPSYIHAGGKIRGFFGRNVFPIMGKDAAGNYWLSGPARAEAWPQIEKALATL
jgi:hypothetical protein